VTNRHDNPTIDRTIKIAGVLNLRDVGGLPLSDPARTPLQGSAADRASRVNPVPADGRARIEGLDPGSDGGGIGTEDGGDERVSGALKSAAHKTVRRGVFYRSAALDKLTDHGAAELERLGVRTVLDLRDDVEAEMAPDLLAGAAVRYERIPIFGSSSGLRWRAGVEGLYEDFVDLCGAAFASCLRLLASDGVAPTLVHCAAGKDRTGFLSALLQTIAGADDAAIVADFAASNTHLGLVDPRSSRSGDGCAEQLVVDGGVHHYVEPSLITCALDRINAGHGSVDAYLLRHGLTRSELDRLRSLLS
jgi:protein-tyrosine phosphatase